MIRKRQFAQQPVDTRQAYVDARFQLQVIGQPGCRPDLEGQPQFGGPRAQDPSEFLAVRFGDLGRSARFRRVPQASDTLSGVTGEPAPDRVFVVPDQARDLPGTEVLFGGEQHDQRPDPELSVLRRPVVGFKLLQLVRTERGHVHGQVTSSGVGQ